MENKIVAFTFFTLFLFTVSAGRLPANLPATNPSVASAGSHIRLPGEKARPDSDESTVKNPLPEPEKRTNFTRFHPINRHFHGKPPRVPKPTGTYRRPFRKSVSEYRVPRTKVADSNSNPETFPGEVPASWLKAKHYYRSRRHHNQPRNNNDDVIKTRNVFDRENLKSLMRQHKQKKSEEETGYMKNIRKFLKHTFD